MTSRSQKLRNKTTLSVAIIWIGSLWLSISANTQPLLQGLVAQELFVEPHSTDSCSLSITEVSYPYTQLSAALFHPTQKDITSDDPNPSNYLLSAGQPDDDGSGQ